MLEMLLQVKNIINQNPQIFRKEFLSSLSGTSIFYLNNSMLKMHAGYDDNSTDYWNYGKNKPEWIGAGFFNVNYDMSYGTPVEYGGDGWEEHLDFLRESGGILRKLYDILIDINYLLPTTTESEDLILLDYTGRGVSYCIADLDKIESVSNPKINFNCYDSSDQVIDKGSITVEEALRKYF